MGVQSPEPLPLSMMKQPQATDKECTTVTVCLVFRLERATDHEKAAQKESNKWTTGPLCGINVVSLASRNCLFQVFAQNVTNEETEK